MSIPTHVDDVIPLMAEGKVLPYLDIPFSTQAPTCSSACGDRLHRKKRSSASGHGARSA
jgi:hypothetical protein